MAAQSREMKTEKQEGARMQHQMKAWNLRVESAESVHCKTEELETDTQM